jgi:hypothetical protein
MCLYFALQKKKGNFQHSSFLAGEATKAAGRLIVADGTLKVNDFEQHISFKFMFFGKMCNHMINYQRNTNVFPLYCIFMPFYLKNMF